MRAWSSRASSPTAPMCQRSSSRAAGLLTSTEKLPRSSPNPGIEPQLSFTQCANACTEMGSQAPR